MFENNLKQFKSWPRGCICNIENKILQKNMIFDTPFLIWSPVICLASLKPSKIDPFQNPILFCKYLGTFHHTEMVLYAKYAYGSQF